MLGCQTPEGKSVVAGLMTAHQGLLPQESPRRAYHLQLALNTCKMQHQLCHQVRCKILLIFDDSKLKACALDTTGQGVTASVVSHWFSSPNNAKLKNPLKP